MAEEAASWDAVLPSEMRVLVASFLAPHDRFVLSLTSKREHALHRFPSLQVTGMIGRDNWFIRTLTRPPHLYVAAELFESAANASAEHGSCAQVAWLWEHTFVHAEYASELHYTIRQHAAQANMVFVAWGMAQYQTYFGAPDDLLLCAVAFDYIEGYEAKKHATPAKDLVAFCIRMGGVAQEQLWGLCADHGFVNTLDCLVREGCVLSPNTCCRLLDTNSGMDQQRVDLVARFLRKQTALHGGAAIFDAYRAVFVMLSNPYHLYDHFKMVADATGYVRTYIGREREPVNFRLTCFVRAAPFRDKAYRPPFVGSLSIEQEVRGHDATYDAYADRWHRETHGARDDV